MLGAGEISLELATHQRTSLPRLEFLKSITCNKFQDVWHTLVYSWWPFLFLDFWSVASFLALLWAFVHFLTDQRRVWLFAHSKSWFYLQRVPCLFPSHWRAPNSLFLAPTLSIWAQPFFHGHYLAHARPILGSRLAIDLPIPVSPAAQLCVGWSASARTIFFVGSKRYCVHFLALWSWTRPANLSLISCESLAWLPN